MQNILEYSDLLLDIFGLQRCVTIDRASGPASNNGVLDNYRKYFPEAGANSTPKEAIDNLIQCSSAKKGECIIAGHGSIGLIGCGGGNHSKDDECIALWLYLNNWREDIAKLKGKAAVITLLACDTGAGCWGLMLLSKISSLTESIVCAPTGAVYCDGMTITYDPGVRMQVVRPGKPLPDPIPATPHKPNNPEGTNRLWLPLMGQLHSFQTTDIALIEIADPQGGEWLSLGPHSSDALDYFDLSYPRKVTGLLLAYPTARVKFHLKGLGESPAIEFLVYNNRYMSCEQEPEFMYYLGPGFGKMIKALQARLRGQENSIF